MDTKILLLMHQILLILTTSVHTIWAFWESLKQSWVWRSWVCYAHGIWRCHKILDKLGICYQMSLNAHKLFLRRNFSSAEDINDCIIANYHLFVIFILGICKTSNFEAVYYCQSCQQMKNICTHHFAHIKY